MRDLFKYVTHNNKQDDCNWCGCTSSEKHQYVCSGEPPAEGTFTKAILDEVKARQVTSACQCGAASLGRESTGHSSWCILSRWTRS